MGKYPNELNPVSWSNFQNLRGFTMFSKEVQIEAVTMYLQCIPPYKIRKKFGIKGINTIRNWVTNIKELGIYGVKDTSRSKTNQQEIYQTCHPMILVFQKQKSTQISMYMLPDQHKQNQILVHRTTKST